MVNLVWALSKMEFYAPSLMDAVAAVASCSLREHTPQARAGFRSPPSAPPLLSTLLPHTAASRRRRPSKPPCQP